ncbi:branched-chain amino acid ABC transporter permease [uncultured Jatrophihabitans sp.]|uniref:branched-chain amino acid ABC transporter permease n=1 Tax=uncultured Jatrophihabitans sp. TaxID=1610747 RepID=UPI0035CA2962
MTTSLLKAPWMKRLIACLAGGVVLAMMVGSQEGSQNDYGYGFRESVLKPRIFVFLLIGVLIFLALTFQGRLVPYVTRPGFWPLVSGGLAVVAGQALMNWNDQIGGGKFTAVANVVADTSGGVLSPVTTAFFAWLAWTAFIVLVLAGGAAIILRLRWLAFAVAAGCVAAAIICFTSHSDVADAARTRGPDHSLGYAAAILGYAVILSAMLATALSKNDVAVGRAALERIAGIRPGLPLVVVGVLLGVLGLTIGVWFSPGHKNLGATDTGSFLNGFASSFSVTYLKWLAWVLLIAAAVLGGAAAYLRQRILGLLAGVIGVAGAVIVLVVLHDISKTGADNNHFDGATGPWQNLGAGGWMTAAAMFLLGAGGVQAALSALRPRQREVALAMTSDLAERPTTGSGGATAIPPASAGLNRGKPSGKEFVRTVAVIAIAAALFYPPTASPFWQQVLVTEIGISMLLAVGLNVVVGWAGLLDLGFIAFYAIGSYTTAYLVGSLPKKPPSWLQLSPLWAIPFAILICLLAGLALGAPTLRLRGDYLAIVTLGFGEIIRIVAVNADSFTKGSQGPSGVPNPVIHIGPIHIQWGLAQLQYWYLLLAIFIVIVLAFRRLENSRLGRSWAAVREDEVAAQAMGINTTQTKLLAFAIGASTSGIAGVFFATQIGSFTPDNFILNNSILIVAYVVFGGMGSLSGAMAGAAMLTWLPRFLQDQVPQQDKLMWIGAVVIAMMIFRPAGLIPAKRRRIEMHGLDGTPRSEPRAVPISEGI